jgi:integrase
MSTLVSRGPGRWLIGTDHGRDPATGKRVRRWTTFRGGRRAARKEQARLEHEAAGAAIAPAKMSVAAFLKTWLTHMKTQVSPRTHENYTELADAITRQLGAVQLDQLKPVHITNAWASALETGRKDGGPLVPNTVRHMNVLFKSALEQACNWELLARNPSAKVKPPAVPKAPITTYGIPDTAKLIAVLKETEIYVPAFLAAMCGLRRGEVCALRWHHVDLSAATVMIVESVEQLNKSVRIKSTKSGRGRAVALGPSTVELLRQHKARQAIDLGKLCLVQGPDTFVCGRADGAMMEPRWLSKRWNTAVKTSGAVIRGFHHLRHACATAMLASGVHPKVASERLGHSSVNITLDVYSHVLPGMQKEAAARVEARYAALEPPPPAPIETAANENSS